MKSRGFVLNKIVIIVQGVAKSFKVQAQDLRIKIAINYAVDYCIGNRIDVFTPKGELKLTKELDKQFKIGAFEP